MSIVQEVGDGSGAGIAKTSVLGAVVMILVSLLTACSGSSAGRPSTDRETIASAEPPAPKRIKLRARWDAAPTHVVTGAGSVWVAMHRADLLFRIDPATGKVERIRTASGACGTAFGFRSVWIADCVDESGVSRVDVRDGTVIPSIGGRFPAVDVVAAAGSIWATHHDADRVLRIDPGTNTVVARIPIGRLPLSLVAGFGSVWAQNGEDGTVSRIDPTTNSVTATISVTDHGQQGVLSKGAGSIWLTDDVDASVHRIDPATGAVTSVEVSDEPCCGFWGKMSATFGMGDLWVELSPTKIGRLDPRSMAIVAELEIDPEVGDLAVVFGSLWIAITDSNELWRLPIPEVSAPGS